jgi:hypothetical protein
VPAGGEACVEVIIRVALMFFFLQFLVVTIIMIVALIFARSK